MSSVMFVCLGNICRSPAGEGILKAFLNNEGVESVRVESSGLGSWHVGELPNPRMRKVARERGYELESRAQLFTPNFFDSFEYILAADRSVYEELVSMAKTDERKKRVFYMTAFSETYKGEEVPDPYYGGEEGFYHVLDMLEESCKGLVSELKQRLCL
jgi:protein-tyrosine phosphatase